MKYDFDEGKALELASIYENSILLAKENDLVLSYIPDLLGRLRYMENCVIHVDKSLLLKPLRLSNAKSLHALKQKNKPHLSQWLPRANEKMQTN